MHVKQKSPSELTLNHSPNLGIFFLSMMEILTITKLPNQLLINLLSYFPNQSSPIRLCTVFPAKYGTINFSAISEFSMKFHIHAY